MLQYVLTSGSLCIYDGPDFVEIGRDHPNFKKIANILSDDTNPSLEEIKSLSSIISAISSASNGKVEVTQCGVFYNGEPIHNSVVDAIFDYQKSGLPITPIVKFLENLMQNPSKNSVDQLWRFIEHHKLPLTEDGHLLAYKAVKSNYKDKYSGTIDNSIGQVIKMDRNKISDDANHHCAQGLHVGGLKYSGPDGWYSSNGDICVIVKVNPKNVVCVPYDHDATKVRVCEYEVVKKYCDVLKSTVYDSDFEEYDSEDWDDEECDWVDNSDIEVGDIVYDGISGVEVVAINDDSCVVRNLVSRKLYDIDLEDLTKD